MLDTDFFNKNKVMQSDLRGGKPPWRSDIGLFSGAVPKQDSECEIVIIGGGITGSLVAQHMTSRGHQVCIIDKEEPGFGSTAASTAMLQWEIDCSLSELTALYGFDRAAVLYHRSYEAAQNLQQLIMHLQLPCSLRTRQSLYLAGENDDAHELKEEHRLRQRAGLPGRHLNASDLKSEFGFDRNGAILSAGSADADPLQLAHGLLNYTLKRGTRLLHAEAIHYECGPKGVTVTLNNGYVIKSRAAVLATGYSMPDFIQSDLHKTASSWAIATPRQNPADLWRDGVLIWEACEPYLYARTTYDGRIIIGGEDDDAITDPLNRDRLMPHKTDVILNKLQRLWPSAQADAEFIWSGAFGETEDGLPLIGKVPQHPHLYAAYGYGGNGITFSFLASRIIASMLDGHFEPWFEAFALDRPNPRKSSFKASSIWT
jgi:glycine/D-amino acid oxidase-like deaminating enzyme